MHEAAARHWVVYAKPPFAGPETVLAYLSRYTHRVAISNSRLLRFDQTGVTFRYKNYRCDGADRQQVMTLTADEFIRRIRHYGLLASGTRKGPPRPRSPAARGRTTRHVQWAGRAGQHPAVVPMLRRAHGRHRNHRTLVPTTRPAARVHP